ncbi:kinase-like domain-containing protein [Radiomyces spectabilis]|uniref:kinase-like domain-containing protein n=1 Tax=Radiomyces spectabilis TaxID=64574 RepID=UPI00221F6670|nr:kinase-like domain-containing protein [Radiomyces spectabilis]KAI8391682.1 kinase-like domain-containing protein [Radiomyces spectabilis]
MPTPASSQKEVRDKDQDKVQAASTADDKTDRPPTPPPTQTELEKQREHEEQRKKAGEERKKVVKQEIDRLNEKFKNLSYYYKIVDRVGSGAFSTVYKAVDLRQDYYDNSAWRVASAAAEKHNFIALKRVYMTSSPDRIANEIAILRDIRGSAYVTPLITAFRQHDQIYIVLPYIEHDNFHTIFRSMSLQDMRYYLKSLFAGLAHLHEQNIIHRDVKPGNFLYNQRHRTGVLVDFGLAQRQANPPAAAANPSKEESQPLLATNNTPGFYRNDPRKPLRANRAGTRGYRAPEVLFRMMHQTFLIYFIAIDIWSVGVLMLSLFTGRYPFFLAHDDSDALVEIATLFGLAEMKACANSHRRTFETNIESIPPTRVSFYRLVLELNNEHAKTWSEQELRDAVDLMAQSLELDWTKRITAKDALQHPFLACI